MEKRYFGHIGIPLKRVHIELTNICDFNCVFCPKSVMKRRYGHMDTDLAKRIICEIADGHIAEKITFHVMGEPTLHPDFFEILSCASEKGIRVGLTTNGGRLGGDIGDQLLRHDLHQIDISLQTPDAGSFVLRRAGALGFEEYQRGILKFFHSYKATGRDTIFKFRFLNTRFRKKGLEKQVGQIKVISSTKELRKVFSHWASRIYDVLGVGGHEREKALKAIMGLVSYKWNVAEVYPGVFFETYLLEDWGHAFRDGNVRDAWGGYCFGMRDHFGILHNGDVVLCCVDFDGKTRVGNLHAGSLRELLSSDELGKIMEGFRRFRLVHPYCRKCLGSTSFFSWLIKPVLSVAALKILKPFFYEQIRLYR
jgi:MoaA/NifB/PqqE/SkfB family radical SAM enzyme